MGLFKEYSEFIQRGNVLDLAVGVIIGAAFGKIVDSLVKDVIMPPIGLVLGKIDFTNQYILLSGGPAIGKDGDRLDLPAAQKLGPVLAYGQFLNNVVSFLIVGFVIFLVVKTANKLKRAMEEEAKKNAPEETAPADAEVKEDPMVKLAVQNEKVIELLEKIAAK